MNFGGTLRLNKFACFTLAFILFVIIYWRSAGVGYPQKSELINLKLLLRASIYAAERGGKKVSEGKKHELNIQSKGETKEGANDPVTNADLSSHCAIYNSLKSSFANVVIISEEHSNKHTCQEEEPLNLDVSPVGQRIIDGMIDEYVLAEDVTLWIDPLDATQEYTEGLNQYVTTMVCVAVKGVPVIGVIHYPFPPRTFWGWFTKRVSSNIPNIAYKQQMREHPRVVVSRSHPGTVTDKAKEAFGPETSVKTAAGAGYKVITVVNGTYDLYLHTTAIKKWDICAGNAILSTLNGNMTTLEGNKIDYSPYNGVKVEEGLLATLYNHDYYLEKLQKTMGLT